MIVLTLFDIVEQQREWSKSVEECIFSARR